MSYNGYKNYPTWNLNLWMDNDYGTYKHYHDELRNLDPYELAECIREDVDRDVEEKVIASGYISDILTWALQQIDYLEIAENIVESREE